MSRPVILATSFGTTFGNTRSITIGAIESTLAESFPEWEVRRAFTSNNIRRILRERDGIFIDSVPEALEKLISEGIKHVVIMPTHFMEGDEYYNKIIATAKVFKDRFESLKVGHTLLTKKEDYKELTEILIKTAETYDDGNTAMVYMGHGTEHAANAGYKMLQDYIFSRGINNIFIGTVEASPNIDDMLESVKKLGSKRVILAPLMIVAGDHARNDMAGNEDDSWKNTFRKAGYDVVCILNGLGSEYAVQKMIVRHCKETIESIE